MIYLYIWILYVYRYVHNTCHSHKEQQQYRKCDKHPSLMMAAEGSRNCNVDVNKTHIVGMNEYANFYGCQLL